MERLSTTTLEPVKRASVPEMVAERILSLIQQGALRPGDKLPSQKELEKMLKVSRPSLREAIAGLIVLGYIEARAGQGYYVRNMDSGKTLDFSVVGALISDETIVHLFEARLIFETNLAQLAARRATDGDIQALYQYLETIEKDLPAAETVLKGLEFHQLMADFAHNPVLSKIEKTLLALFEEFAPRIFADSPSYDSDVESHRRIVDRIAAHDAQGAGELAFQHIQVFADELGLHLGDDPPVPLQAKSRMARGNKRGRD